MVTGGGELVTGIVVVGGEVVAGAVVVLLLAEKIFWCVLKYLNLNDKMTCKLEGRDVMQSLLKSVNSLLKSQFKCNLTQYDYFPCSSFLLEYTFERSFIPGGGVC